MVFNLKKVTKLIKLNKEISLVLLLTIVTITSTLSYNNSKKQIYENYKKTLNNIHFKKTFNHVFDNLNPRYKSINHKISKFFFINFVTFLKLKNIMNLCY